jgi:hypothetical protein
VIFSPSEILPVVEATGFKADAIEKVLQLLNLLNKLNSHPFLKGKFALQGGSALNLFVFDTMNRKDWRTVSSEDVDFAADELSHRLLPLLRVRSAEEDQSSASYGKRLVKECRDKLSVVLPLKDSETEFLNRLLDEGEIVPSLLTPDHDLQERISRHPLLAWKALNVREYKKGCRS